MRERLDGLLDAPAFGRKVPPSSQSDLRNSMILQRKLGGLVDVQFMAAQQHLHAIDRPVRELDHVTAFLVELKPALFQARCFEHLLEHPGDLIRLRDEQREHRARLWRQLTQRARLQHGQVSLDDRHGPPQLVGGDIQEVDLRLFESLDPRRPRHAVEARGDADRVLGEVAELVIAEDRRQAPGDEDDRPRAVLQIQWNYEHVVFAPRLMSLSGHGLEVSASRDLLSRGGIKAL